MDDKRIHGSLLFLLLAYAAASLFHHLHNAEFLADYPNLPGWISRANVYAAWLALTALGLAGYLLVRRGHRLAGLALIAAYAALGFDSLAHYALAPWSAHTALMNLSIGLETATAALLLVAAARRVSRWRPPG